MMRSGTAVPLIYVLLGALVLTLVIESYADAVVIALVLAVNATVGFFQEYRAESAVRSLTEMISPKALVRRGGDEREIDSEELVPGDVVVLEQGEVVPADLRLLDVEGLRVNEAALTGESVPADKQVDALEEKMHLPPADQRNMAFMSTAVSSGGGSGVVVAIGGKTEIGRIAEDVEAVGQVRTPLQERIDRLAKGITVATLVLAGIIFAVGVLLDRGVEEMLLFSAALAVGAIPEGLPIVVTVALAIGVRRMARREVVIRHLPAVDTLGSCTIIVTDKTGTLTQNRMTVRAVVGGDVRLDVDDEGLCRNGKPVELSEHCAARQTLLVGLLCNDAKLGDGEEREAAGDPMEIALLEAGRRAGMDRAESERRYPLRDKVPFRAERRFMATIHDLRENEDEGPLVLVKGAPERIAEMCDRRLDADGAESEFDADAAVERSEQLAAEGLRMLAMAVGHGDGAADAVRGDNPSGLTFAGMQALLDPPRETAVSAVDACHDAGIRVAMVTGDHSTTAAAIGEQIHIDGAQQRAAVRRGRELAELSDDELDEILGDVNIYARVAPEQKLRIVERLKEQGEVVAVTGDGVNDAPALESAHLGAAMGSGTDVAKEASDMVIADDDFASIYAAVEEGRTSFRNIRMATFFLLSTAAAYVVVFPTGLLLGWPLVLLPAQILWLNVVTNGIADVALAFEPGEKSLFRRPPRRPSEGVLDRVLLERLVIVGAWLGIGTLAMFWWQWGIQDEDLTTARTATLTTFVLFQKVHVFNCRSEDVSIFKTNLLTNKVLFLGVLASLGVHIAALHIPLTQQVLRVEPLSLGTWLVATGIALTAIIVNEAHKRLRPRWR